MFNDYYLLKRAPKEEGVVAFAEVQDDFTYRGEVVRVPNHNSSSIPNNNPHVGDKIRFLKGSGEDVVVDGEQMKAVKLEDIIMVI